MVNQMREVHTEIALTINGCPKLPVLINGHEVDYDIRFVDMDIAVDGDDVGCGDVGKVVILQYVDGKLTDYDCVDFESAGGVVDYFDSRLFGFNGARIWNG